MVEFGIGLVLFVLLSIFFEVLKHIIGERRLNLLLGFIFLISAFLNGFISVDIFLFSHFLYNTNSLSEILFELIFGIVSLSSLYISYSLILENKQFYNYAVFMLIFLFSYFSIYMIRNLNKEIRIEDYKNIEVIHKKIENNIEINEKFKKIFLDIKQDNFISVREYRKLKKLEKYFKFLQQQKGELEESIKTDMEKTKILNKLNKNTSY